MTMALKGSRDHQYDLGLEYMIGSPEIIPKNMKEAFFWFSRAAAQGCAEAIIMLSRCYDKGHGTLKDAKEGRRLRNLYEIQVRLKEILEDQGSEKEKEKENEKDKEIVMKTLMLGIYQFTGDIK